jgi:hypothetical protein
MNLQDIRLDDGSLPAYAWPGGYNLFYFDEENLVLCPSCANKEDMSTEVVAYDVNWEDESLYCDDCSKQIHSSYGDDEEEEEENTILDNDAIKRATIADN